MSSEVLHGITVDYTRDNLFSESGLGRLKDGYMVDGETSPQQRFAFVSKTFSSNPEHAQRLYDYSSKMWLSYATPILSYGKTSRSLPISCYAARLNDSMRSILDTSSETRMLAVVGGGVGLHVGLRPGDKKSSGIIPHLKTYDVDTLAFKQGTTRRGATAAYLDINHPEIVDFLEMRKPTGGDPNRKCLNLHHGINISDDFMRRVETLSLHSSSLSQAEKEQLDKFPLVNPYSGEVVEHISVKELWERILTVRMETGEPYLLFIDTCNNDMNEDQKQAGLKIRGSNLCLTGDTLIEIKDTCDAEPQTVRLDEFVEKFQMGYYCHPLVKTNFGDSVGWTFVSAAAETAVVNELYEIELPNGVTIRCTGDHQIFTKNRGYVQAKDLQETDQLLDDVLNSIEISQIRKLNVEPTAVYDITVPETENFFANGIQVHNCSEITLPTDDDRTFVCCLSSVNLEHYDEWKDNPLFISDIVEMLDNVITVFCEKAKQFPEISRAVYSAMRERSIGIGAMGWHALLQKRNVPFESALAVGLNKSIWIKMSDQAKRKTVELAKQRGPCPDTANGPKPVRNANLFAIAPTASSSIIMNTSPSIEPYRANVYLEKGVNGTKVHKNKYLEMLLNTKDKNTQEVWSKIIANDGSVKSLDFLTDYEKDVFKTSMEIDQRWLVQHAIDRQPYICQAQSLNLFFSPTTNVEYLHLIHLMAWKGGLKSLYYCRSDNMRKADNVGQKVVRERIEDMKDSLKLDEPVCIACE